MSTDATPPPLPPPPAGPRPPFVDAEWAVSSPDRPDAVQRALEIWRATLATSYVLAILLGGIPSFVGQLLRRSAAGTTELSTWIHTGHWPAGYLTQPQPAANPWSGPISILSNLLTLLVYVALLRLMMGAAVGERRGLGETISLGWARFGKTFVIGLCALLVEMALLIPLGIVFVILVTVHEWKIGAIVLSAGAALAISAVSLSIAAFVAEGVTGFQAIGRSWHLAWRARRLVFGLIGAVFLGGMWISLGTSFLISHVFTGVAARWMHAVYLLVGAPLITTVTGALIASVYLEVRARTEGQTEAGALAGALAAGDPFR